MTLWMCQEGRGSRPRAPCTTQTVTMRMKMVLTTLIMEEMGKIEEEATTETVKTVTVTQTVIDPEVLAEHKAHVARLEEELETERSCRREADSEIMRLRAQIGGISLSEVDASAHSVGADTQGSDVTTGRDKIESPARAQEHPPVAPKKLQLRCVHSIFVASCNDIFMYELAAREVFFDGIYTNVNLYVTSYEMIV